MNTELLWLYLFTRLDGFVSLALVLAMFSGMAFVFVLIIGSDGRWDGRDKWLRRLAIVCAVATVLAVFLPRKQDVMFMAAGSAALNAARTDTAKRIASKSVQVIESFLDQQLKKTKE